MEFNKLGVEELMRIYGLSEKSAQQIVERRIQTDQKIAEITERINALKKGEMFVLCIWHEQHGPHPIGVSSNVNALEQRAAVSFSSKAWTKDNPSILRNVVQSKQLDENEYLLILRVPEF